MKTKICILFLISVISFIACKKSKDENTNKVEAVYVSFYKDGYKRDFRLPQSSLFWSELSVSWGFQNKQNPPEGFSFYLSGIADTGNYEIKPAQGSPATLSYTDSLNNSFQLRRGNFKLDVCDTANYMYRGSFDGTFMNQNQDDSFIAKNGEFYFQKLQ